MAKIVYVLAVAAFFVFCDAEKVPAEKPPVTAEGNSTKKWFMLSKNEYCSAKCEVIKCPEAIRCTKDQEDCGLEEPDPIHGDMCEESSICVPKDCNCK